MALLKRTITDNDAVRIEFEDLFDKPCNIQQSTIHTIPAIWMGRESARMVLTQDLAKELLPILEKFAKTGEI